MSTPNLMFSSEPSDQLQGLQELGLNLDRIGELLASRCQPEESAPEQSGWAVRVHSALDEHRALLDERIALLEQQRAEVGVAERKLESCATCRHQPSAANNFCEPCPQTGESLPAYLSALF